MDGRLVRKWIERAAGAAIEDDWGSGDPILLLTNDQVPEDFVGGPGVRAGVCMCEFGIESLEQATHHGVRAFKNSGGLGE